MKKLATVLAIGTALVAGSVSASPVNVGGVVWDPASLDDYFATDTMYESVAIPTGAMSTGVANVYDFTGSNELKGYGKITNINGDTTTFCPGCELTYQFGGLYLNQWIDVDGDGSVDAGDHISFTGGWVNFYVDFTPDFNNVSSASAGDEGGANNLWLSLAGNTQTATYGANSISGTLFSTITTGTLGTGTEGGNGFGNFDVTGGLANANFDTDSQVGGSDFRFTSSYQPRTCSPTCPEGNNLFGSNDIYADSIPEPGMLALFGAGLIGLGATAVRRRKIAA
ncbi:MAG: PEP-CTERM sorting domain-containing protein [Gammaproteobacteria bacterium]|nr:PEP-CTERM sorting domain-containing protein [Gammaproteobacteria bacterium]